MDARISLVVILIVAVLFLVWLGLVMRGASVALPAKKKNSRIVHSDRMLDYARLAVQREDYELALDLCSQIFEQPQAYETFPEALRLRIDVLERMQRLDEAEQDIRRLRLLDPSGDMTDLTPVLPIDEAPVEEKQHHS